MDLVNLRHNNNILKERIKEEQDYIIKFQQLEEEVRKELSNQQVYSFY